MSSEPLWLQTHNGDTDRGAHGEEKEARTAASAATDGDAAAATLPGNGEGVSGKRRASASLRPSATAATAAAAGVSGHDDGREGGQDRDAH